ncbi:MAG: protoporphyrinogen oxidase, partial [Candidatus Heimdallarchaeota archaeon]|nr:protoporphyrinogen oxidase [Candidatus Heimdallarchaeota archaeon]MDH5645931.1 protoporphyrinogen oxidase [Candidatus Heimdallarchaeota archaeon]
MEKKKIIIIGAGISGLTIANGLIRSGISNNEILVLEQKDRPGGLIKTTIDNGFLTEWGPEGLRGKSENTHYLFSLIDKEKIAASDEAAKRYLVKNGKLVTVPSGPISAIFTPLIPFFGKLRLLKEPFIKPTTEEETVKEFISRRFGKGLVPILDAFVTGIFGGNISEINVKYSFPMLKQAELFGGSVIRGFLKQNKISKNSGKKKDKTKQPHLYTTEKGMQGIIDDLSTKVNIKYNTTITEINSNSDTIQINSNAEQYSCDKLIVATGVSASNRIKFFDEPILPLNNQSVISIVTLGYNPTAFPKPLNGYGFLSPSSEEVGILGTLFTSRLFPHHSKNNVELLRVFVGGKRHPEKIKLNPEEIIQQVIQDLNKLLNLQEEPIYTSIVSHNPDGISQFQMNHSIYINWKEHIETKYNQITLAGIGWTSISCDGLIAEARKIINKISPQS